MESSASALVPSHPFLLPRIPSLRGRLWRHKEGEGAALGFLFSVGECKESSQSSWNSARDTLQENKQSCHRELGKEFSFPPFFKCTQFSSPLLSLPSPFFPPSDLSGQKIPWSQMQTPSKEDMDSKCHMANKTYFTADLTFNKQIDHCKKKKTGPKSWYKTIPNTQTLNYSYLNNSLKNIQIKKDFLKITILGFSALTNLKVWGHRSQELIWVNSDGRDEVGKITSNYLFLPLKNNEFGNRSNFRKSDYRFSAQRNLSLLETPSTWVHMYFLWPSTYPYSITLEGLIKDKIQLFITYPANYFWSSIKRAGKAAQHKP